MPPTDSSAPFRPPFTVGPWTVQPDRLRLVGEDGEIRTARLKIMELLLCLAEEPGRVVGKEELRRRVWTDATVSDEVLRRTVFELRQTLGDDSAEPRFVETVPGRGYRLRPQEVQAAEPAAEAEARGAGVFARPSPLALVVALAALFLVAVALLLPDAEPPAPRLRPLPASPGEKAQAVLSPDGSQAAYVARLEGAAADLFLLEIDGPFPRVLTETPEAEAAPTFGPDARRLAFLRRFAGGDEIRILALERPGAAEERICRLEGFAEGLRWSPSGDLFAFSLRPPGEAAGIFVADAGTCALRRLTTPPAASLGDAMPAWSPQGDRLAFVRRWSPEAGALLTVQADDPSDLREVVAPGAPVESPSWTPGGALLFVKAEPGINHLWEVPASGGEPRSVTRLSEHPFWPHLSADGERLIFVDVASNADLWMLDLTAPQAVPRQVFRSPAAEYAPALAPDGRRLAYVGEGSGHPEVWTAALDGTGRRRESAAEGPFLDRLSWSPDGTTLVFEVRGGRGTDVAFLRPGSAEPQPPRLLAPHPAHDRRPVFTADGTGILFISDRGGSRQVWRLDVAGGEPRPATARPLPDLAADALLDQGPAGLAFADQGRLYRRLPRGETEPPLPVPPSALDLRWGLAGGRLFSAEGDGGRLTLRSYDLATGAPRDLATLRDFGYDPGLAVSADGSFLVWSAIEQYATELRLVEGLAGP